VKTARILKELILIVPSFRIVSLEASQISKNVDVFSSNLLFSAVLVFVAQERASPIRFVIIALIARDALLSSPLSPVSNLGHTFNPVLRI